MTNYYSLLCLLHTGEKVVVHKHEGHIQSRIVYYLMNIHITPRTIYLTRVSLYVHCSLVIFIVVVSANKCLLISANMFEQHGESEMNVEGRIGGDSDLSYRGKLYATALSNYIHQQDIPGLRVWTSWLKRTIQTVATIPAPQERWKALNEIDAVSVIPVYIRQLNYMYQCQHPF